ncbi:hypothetical protein BX600DRAFT_515509 [Xylariales sp. PMI_506]|nr:hypothetical protein BX600DRAFT_515509 [Xylariales sp. PMI_506]
MTSMHQHHELSGSYQQQPYTSEYERLYPGQQPEAAGGEKLAKTIKRWKRRISLIRAASRAITALFDSIMFALMSFVIAVFLATRHDEALGRPIWPRDPKTWPTIMLLVASLVTMTASILVALYYCCCFKRAKDSWKVILVTYSIHIGIWIVVTFLYRWEKALNDLWGWSCTDIAAELQSKGNINVDFGKLCALQGASWIISIIKTSFTVLFAIVNFLIYRKLKKTDKAKRYLAQGAGEGAMGILNAVF